MKPISEWTDAELENWSLRGNYISDESAGLAAEVLRLRAVNIKNADAYMASLEQVNENLHFAQQRAADNDLRARIGEDKIAVLKARLHAVDALRNDPSLIHMGTVDMGLIREALDG